MFENGIPAKYGDKGYEKDVTILDFIWIPEHITSGRYVEPGQLYAVFVYKDTTISDRIHKQPLEYLKWEKK